MPAILTCNLACVAIALLYCTWRRLSVPQKKHVDLRERVAYMLWTAANRTA